MFTEIQAAMQRLADGYQGNDAAAIEEATNALTKMGHAKVALAALPETKRLSVILLRWGRTGWEKDRGLSVEEIASVLSVPEMVVNAVIAHREAWERRLQEADVERARAERDAALDAIKAERAAVREAVQFFACPECGAAAGSRCVTRVGTKRSTHWKRRAHIPRAPRYDDCPPNDW